MADTKQAEVDGYNAFAGNVQKRGRRIADTCVR